MSQVADTTTLTAAELAERLALLYGWSPAHDDGSERERALFVLWRDWMRAYEAEGGSLRPRDHGELSDEAIHALALRRHEKYRRVAALTTSSPEDEIGAAIERRAAVMEGWAADPDLRPASRWLSLPVALAILRGTHPALRSTPSSSPRTPTDG